MSEPVALSALPPGASGRVDHIIAQPAMACRLTDLGLVPGTAVTCVLKAPAGDPKAYRIRGALIALRRADAAGIILEGPGQSPAVQS